MKGDFSQLRFDPRENISALLHQQGRVLSDADITEAARVQLDWDDRTARDVIGKGVAAVPADETAGFQVIAIDKNPPGALTATVQPGRIWADGLHAYLNEAAPVKRTASFIGTIPATFNPGDRDAILLKVWRETLSSFQDPARWIEPALGGPDTATRVLTSFAFHSVRMLKEETCQAAAARAASPSTGLLSVTLAPLVETQGECPTTAQGGYTGFEHNLYRVEIAGNGTPTPTHFKWSQFNGGLVGRATVNVAKKELTVIANRDAIMTSGLTQCQLDVVQWDALLGHWRVTQSTDATLNAGTGVITLTNAPAFTVTDKDGAVFIRLWNGLLPLATFTGVDKELQDGIRFNFASGTLRAGDYWTFSVRAGAISNEVKLITSQPPAGPEYHVVALAEVMWGTNPLLIEDCRRRFRPLTNQKCCCTFLVGDGFSTFGDFNSLEEAALHLPPQGGKLCLMPGIHFANLQLSRNNVTIEGCEHQTYLLPRLDEKSVQQPIITVTKSQGIEISGIYFIGLRGITIRLESVNDVLVTRNRVVGNVHALRATDANDLRITDNHFYQWDLDDSTALVSVEAFNSLIARNELIVVPQDFPVPENPDNPGNKWPGEPCSDFKDWVDQHQYVATAANTIFSTILYYTPKSPYRALGGLHLRPGCDDVKVLSNHIFGGKGDGITLGGKIAAEDHPTADEPSNVWTKSRFKFQQTLNVYVRDKNGKVEGVTVTLTPNPGGTSITGVSDKNGIFSTGTSGAFDYELSVNPEYVIIDVSLNQKEFTSELTVTVEFRADNPGLAYLHDIRIDDNEIEYMGECGINFGRITDKLRLPPGDPPAFPKTSGKDTPTRQKLFEDFWQQVAQYLTDVNIKAVDLNDATSKVNGLVVRNNRIHDNVLNALTAEAFKRLMLHGRGGISLGLVDTALIQGNEIFDNGLSNSSVSPVCGLYLGHGENVEISGNRITNNGWGDSPGQGIRGGIYVRFATTLVPSHGTSAQHAALRVHDNRVEQPAGRALTAFTFGPVSIVNNHLASKHGGNYWLLDRSVGVLLVVNLGLLQRVILSDGRATERELYVKRSHIPSGNTQVSGNQILLGDDDRDLKDPQTPLSTQFVITPDDLGYTDNYSQCLHTDALASNAFLLADILRATASRFNEISPEANFSLISHASRMNTSVHNQGDNCFLVRCPSGLKKDDNLTLRKDCKDDGAKSLQEIILDMLHTASGVTGYTSVTVATLAPKMAGVAFVGYRACQKEALATTEREMSHLLTANRPNARIEGLRYQWQERKALLTELNSVDVPGAPAETIVSQDYDKASLAPSDKAPPAQAVETKEALVRQAEPASSIPLSKLGISTDIKKRLVEAGYKDCQAVASAKLEDLKEIVGADAQALRAKAIALVKKTAAK